MLTTCSEIHCNTSNVPQGSVLGPLLFLIDVNDIGDAVHNVDVKLFADDTNLFVANPANAKLNIDANSYFSQLYQWLIANKLSLNITKTCCMVFHLKIRMSSRY